MRLKYSQLANIILYVTMALFLIDIGNAKYICAYLAIALLIVLNYYRNERVVFKNFRYECKWLLLILAAFVFVTVIKQIINGFNSYFINEIVYYITPLLFMVAFLQLQDSQSIFSTINGLFVVFMIAFVVKAAPDFTLESIRSTSFANTYSPFEGTGLAFVFVLFVFYYYYRKNLPMELVSLFMVFLTMKRMAFVASIVVVVLSVLTYTLHTSTMTVKRWMVVVACVVFIALPVITGYLLNDAFAYWFQSKTGLNLDTFVMGRFFRLNEVTDKNAGRLGWGSTTTYLTKYLGDYYLSDKNFNLHNDVYKIYLETGIVGTMVFTIGMFKSCQRNYMSFLMVVYLFLELFVNHQMGAGSFTYWITLYSLLFCFNVQSREKTYQMNPLVNTNNNY